MEATEIPLEVMVVGSGLSHHVLEGLGKLYLREIRQALLWVDRVNEAVLDVVCIT